MVTGIFARADHPNGWGNAHGYVVIAVECENLAQLAAVTSRLQRDPFYGRPLATSYPGGYLGDEGHPWFAGRFDRILTTRGKVNVTPYGNQMPDTFACIGDQRFAGVFSAADVLPDDN
jgi:hypothetical protein